MLNVAGGKAFAVGSWDAANERMVKVSRWMQTVDSSAFNMANWFVAGSADDGRVLTFGDLQQGKNRDGAPNVTADNGVLLSPIWTMTSVRVVSWDGQAKQLVANPPAEMVQLRNRSLCAEAGVGLRPRVPHRLPFPEGEGATMDLELELELPPSAFTLGLRVLGEASGTGNATTLRLHVAASSGGFRAGNATLFTTRGTVTNCTSAFEVLAGESTIALRMLVDRSVIEAFVAGGRAVLTGRDYPSISETAAHVTLEEGPPVTVRSARAWSMECAWV